MTLTRTWSGSTWSGGILPRLARTLVLWSVAGALLAASAVFAPSIVIAPSAWGEPSEATSLEQVKTSLDEIESDIGRDDITSEALAGLKQKLNAAADALKGKIEELEPRAGEVEERLKQLGPAPAKDAAPETAEVASEREDLTTTFSELDGALKQARLLLLRVDQLSERVAQKRHALYASELFARTASALDPFFWADAFRALSVEFHSARALLETWWNERHDSVLSTLAVLILLGIAAATIAIHRWWFPRLSEWPCDTRAAKGWTALWVFVWLALRTPVASFAALMVLDSLGLLTFRLEQILEGLVVGIAAASFGNGVARGLFAPERPERRLVQEDD
ncbi:MAG TPA: DUF3772 domain-containing protein, partial [Steroidobacteraceae bacterium]|nr:DUF3772 domain-containing protein [Steroidobacteraceae bacterium]